MKWLDGVTTSPSEGGCVAHLEPCKALGKRLEGVELVKCLSCIRRDGYRFVVKAPASTCTGSRFNK